MERRERDNKRRSSILLIRFYLQNGSSRLDQARRNLLERSKWHASRIMSITPQLREFHALSSLKDIPLIPVILNPVSVSSRYNESKELDLGKLSRPLQLVLKSSFNESQLQAICAAIGSRKIKKEFELSLIQGPPGISFLISNCFFFSYFENLLMDLGIFCIFQVIYFYYRDWEDPYYSGHCQCCACYEKIFEWSSEAKL